ncbi:MAG: MFS transporter [Legionellales bacterium]|nr:MFS transporter [Legionellales bacterium]
MPHQRTSFRWWIVALLFFITWVNYIDRASIAYAIDGMALAFHWSSSDIGLILGAFGLGYVVTTLLGGIAADRYGAKRTLTLSVLFWGIASLLMGISTGFFMVFVARIILGVAEGPNFPALTRTVSDWLSEEERSRALSFSLVSVPLALALGGPIVTQLIAAFSWRGAYFILALVAFLWIPFWWFLFKDNPADSSFVNQAELAHIQKPETIPSKTMGSSHPWKVLLFDRTLLANNWAFFVFGYYLFFFMTWLPRYLHDQYHLDMTQIGFYSMAPWLCAAGMIWGVGVLSDNVFKKTGNLRLARSYPIIITQALSAACIIPLLMVTQVFWAMVYVSLAVGFAMSANAVFYAVNIDVAKERAGTALGIMDAVFAVAGFLAPTLTGVLVSITGHYESAFVLLTGLALSSSLMTWHLHNKA